MKRTACTITLLAAAAIAVSGCAPAISGRSKDPGEVNLTLPNYRKCFIADPVEKRAKIDWAQIVSTEPKEVTWKRTNGNKHVYFLPSPEEQFPFLFPTLIGKLPQGKLERKSGVPNIPNDWDGWNKDADGKDDSYTFRYIVVYKGEECDPEICIRKSGSGCSG